MGIACLGLDHCTGSQAQCQGFWPLLSTANSLVGSLKRLREFTFQIHGLRSEKLKNRFHQLLPCPRNLITRTLNHRIYYGAFTLACSPEISPDSDDFLFG
jgi:hypothetical protein